MTCYEILGVGEGVTKKQLDKTRQRLMKKLTSNIVNEEKMEAVELMGLINKAHAILADDNRRLHYDLYPEQLYVSEKLRSKLVNLHDICYYVEIPISGYVNRITAMPQCCVCCTTSNPSTEFSVSRAEGLKYFIQLKMQFPLCSECAEHILKSASTFYWVTILPAAIACVIATVIGILVDDSLRVITTTVLPSAISLGLFLLMAMRIRLRTGSLSHAAHRFPARVKFIDEKSICFLFYNRVFAEKFASCNGGKFRFWIQKRGISFLQGFEKPWDAVWAWIGWTFLAIKLSSLISQQF